MKSSLSHGRALGARIGSIAFTLLFMLSSVASFAQVPDPADRSTTFRVQKYGDAILLPVTTFGVSEMFLLDSGTSLHILDMRFRPRLGTPIVTAQAETAESTIPVKLYKSPRLLIGSSLLGGERPVINFDLTPASNAVGHDLGGILGGPLFLEYIVSVDFDHGIVQLLSPDETPRVSWGIPIRVDVDSNGCALVKNVTIGSETMSFALDTGMSGSLSFTGDGFDRLLSEGTIALIGSMSAYTANGDVESRLGRIDSMELGPFHSESVLVTESAGNKIGLGYLSRFRLTFDLSRERLYLARGNAFAKTDELDKSGLYLKWINNRVVIVAVDDNSPAYHAGIVKDDVVISINGRSTIDMTLDEVRRQFKRRSGAEQSLSILRGDEELNVQFLLRRVVDWHTANSGPRE